MEVYFPMQTKMRAEELLIHTIHQLFSPSSFHFIRNIRHVVHINIFLPLDMTQVRESLSFILFQGTFFKSTPLLLSVRTAKIVEIILIKTEKIKIQFNYDIKVEDLASVCNRLKCITLSSKASLPPCVYTFLNCLRDNHSAYEILPRCPAQFFLPLPLKCLSKFPPRQDPSFGAQTYGEPKPGCGPCPFLFLSSR